MTDYIKKISDGKYSYEITKEHKFIVPDMEVGCWDCYYADKLVASGRHNTLTVYPGYQWDGCTVIGKIYENEVTLQASILHDVLYNVGKNSDYFPHFILSDVDLWFRQLMEQLYAPKKSIIPGLYYWIITIFGWPWKFGTNPGYKILNTSNSK